MWCVCFKGVNWVFLQKITAWGSMGNWVFTRVIVCLLQLSPQLRPLPHEGSIWISHCFLSRFGLFWPFCFKNLSVLNCIWEQLSKLHLLKSILFSYSCLTNLYLEVNISNINLLHQYWWNVRVNGAWKGPRPMWNISLFSSNGSQF